MNKLMIIGNLTKDPVMRTTATGLSVCSFTVAVNRRKAQGQQQEADYFNVTAWRERGETCAKYLAKGKKVCVIGPVSVRNWETQDGKYGSALEVTADEVEFLSPRSEGESAPVHKPPKVDEQSGFEEVETEELPF